MLRIAPDTNLLRAIAARRFLCALVEQQGGRIVVLPTAIWRARPSSARSATATAGKRSTTSRSSAKLSNGT